jgi:hypothetical protein
MSKKNSIATLSTGLGSELGPATDETDWTGSTGWGHDGVFGLIYRNGKHPTDPEKSFLFLHFFHINFVKIYIVCKKIFCKAIHESWERRQGSAAVPHGGRKARPRR